MALDKLVDSAQLDSDLTSVANAIRTKGGTSAILAFPQGFVSAVQNIQTGITPTGTKQIAITENGTTTEDVAAYANAEITVDVQGGSADWDGFANGTWPVGDVVLGAGVTSIRDYKFLAMTGITSIRAVGVTSINQYAFRGCTALTSAEFPELTEMNGQYTFNGCTALRSIVMPKLKSMSSPQGYNFSGVRGVTLHFPEMTSNTGNYGFRELGASGHPCVVVLPKIQTLSWHTFRGAILTAVDIGPDLQTLPAGCFYQTNGCTLILRRTDAIVAAAGADSLSNYGTARFTVYCPSSLIEQYKVATNWATKYDGGYITFIPLEGSIYETQYADGTPIT